MGRQPGEKLLLYPKRGEAICGVRRRFLLCERVATYGTHASKGILMRACTRERLSPALPTPCPNPVQTLSKPCPALPSPAQPRSS